MEEQFFLEEGEVFSFSEPSNKPGRKFTQDNSPTVFDEFSTNYNLSDYEDEYVTLGQEGLKGLELDAYNQDDYFVWTLFILIGGYVLFKLLFGSSKSELK